MVFGRSIKRSQETFLSHIPPRAKVLVLGGGTGWILNSILRENPSVSITYIDASAIMIQLATKAIDDHCRSQVQLIHGTQLDIPPSHSYQVVITPFFLDLFEEPVLPELIAFILTKLSADGIWLCTDFSSQPALWWQKALANLMRLFFKWTCGLKLNKIPDVEEALLRAGLRTKDKKHFYRGMIISLSMRKPL